MNKNHHPVLTEVDDAWITPTQVGYDKANYQSSDNLPTPKVTIAGVVLGIACTVPVAWSDTSAISSGDWFDADNWSNGIPAADGITNIKSNVIMDLQSAGAESNSTNIGSANGSTVNITDLGTLSDSGSRIGTEADTTGVVNVSGPSAEWSSPFLDIAREGTGTLNIREGGQVSAAISVKIGFGAGDESNATVNVDGAGSSLTSPIELKVASANNSTLNISNGGTVSSQLEVRMSAAKAR